MLAPLLLTGSCLLLLATEPSTKPSTTPEELIRQLSDRRFKLRQAAAKAIEALGPAALPALRNAKDSPDPGVRLQIARWIPKFEMEAAVAPRLVTLHIKQRPLFEAIESVAKQSRYRIDLVDNGTRRMLPCSLDLTNVPFWQALDAICVQGRLISLGKPDLYAAERAASSVYCHGAFRVAAGDLTYTRRRSPATASAGQKPAAFGEIDSVGLSLEVAVEPRLAILQAECTEVTEVNDDRGRSWLKKSVASEFAYSPPRALWSGYRVALPRLRIDVCFKAPSLGAKSIKLVKGVIPLTVATDKDKNRAVIAEHITNGKFHRCKLGGVELETTGACRLPSGNVEVRLALKSALPLTRDPAIAEDFELTDPKGNKFKLNDSNVSEVSTTEQRWSLEFKPPVGAGQGCTPAQLAYSYWDAVDYRLPFEFHDLALP